MKFVIIFSIYFLELEIYFRNRFKKKLLGFLFANREIYVRKKFPNQLKNSNWEKKTSRLNLMAVEKSPCKKKKKKEKKKKEEFKGLFFELSDELLNRIWSLYKNSVNVVYVLSKDFLKAEVREEVKSRDAQGGVTNK